MPPIRDPSVGWAGTSVESRAEIFVEQQVGFGQEADTVIGSVVPVGIEPGAGIGLEVGIEFELEAGFDTEQVDIGRDKTVHLFELAYLSFSDRKQH